MNSETRNTGMKSLLSALSDGFSAEEILFAHYASDIAAAITSRRIELGLTQKELAEKLKKSQALISKWESADCNFTLRTLIEIAQNLDLSLNITLNRGKAPSTEHRTDNNIIRIYGGYQAVTSPESTWSRVASTDDELQEM